MAIASKLMMFVLMFAILIVVRYILDVVKAFRSGAKELNRTWKDDLILGLALSYILTIIFTGFSLV